MRVVEFRGSAVKRQRKIGPDQILIVFYDRAPEVVSVNEWETFSKNQYYENDVRRCDVVRNTNLKPMKVTNVNNRRAAAAAG
jgi:hypothetical protein